MQKPGPHLHFRAGDVSLVLDCSGPLLPRARHWGADLGDLSDADLADLMLSAEAQGITNTLDQQVPLALLPEPSAGWLGTPGLTGHCDGTDF